MPPGRRVVPTQPPGVRKIATTRELGSFLRDQRLNRRMSQAAMGALLGESRQKVQQIEAGAGGVAVSTVLRALDGLGVCLVAVPPRLSAISGAPEDEVFDRAEELLNMLGEEA